MYGCHRKNKVHPHHRQDNFNAVRNRDTILHAVTMSYLVSVCMGRNAILQRPSTQSTQIKGHCKLCAWTGGVILQNVIRPHIEGVRHCDWILNGEWCPCISQYWGCLVWDDSQPCFSCGSHTYTTTSATRCYALSVRQSAWHSPCRIHTSNRSSNTQNTHIISSNVEDKLGCSVYQRLREKRIDWILDTHTHTSRMIQSWTQKLKFGHIFFVTHWRK